MFHTEYRLELFLKADLKDIFNFVKGRLEIFGFKVKKKIPYTYIKAKMGGFFSQTRRSLELRLIPHDKGFI